MSLALVDEHKGNYELQVDYGDTYRLIYFSRIDAARSFIALIAGQDAESMRELLA